jgi:hypothetical protein
MIRVPLCKLFNFKWIRVPARVGMGLVGQEAATTAPDATPNGEALVRVVMVGRGFQVIEDSIGSP